MTLKGMPAEPQDRTEQVKAICSLYFKSVEPKAGSETGDRCSRLSVIDRARKYMDRLPVAVSGQGGHNATFRAACVLLIGFALNKSEALCLMSEFNQRCQPPWSEKELMHKINSADKQPGSADTCAMPSPNNGTTSTYRITNNPTNRSRKRSGSGHGRKRRPSTWQH